MTKLDSPKESESTPPPEPSALSAEASHLMTQRAERPRWHPLVLDANGEHTVKAGESLSLLACQELRRRGQPVSSRNIAGEIDRIVALNADKYPSLQEHPERIRIGWKLKISDVEDGAGESTPNRRYTQAQPGKMTVVHKGEHVEAPKDAWLIIEPGGSAILNPGSRGFLAHDARIEKALPGSVIIATGGEIVDFGADIQIAGPDVRVFKGER
jgi:hypothetical protein